MKTVSEVSGLPDTDSTFVTSDMRLHLGPTVVPSMNRNGGITNISDLLFNTLPEVVS